MHFAVTVLLWMYFVSTCYADTTVTLTPGPLCNMANISALNDDIITKLNITFNSNSSQQWNKAAYDLVLILRGTYGIKSDWITVITGEAVSISTSYAQMFCQLEIIDEAVLRYVYIYSTTNFMASSYQAVHTNEVKSAGTQLFCGLDADSVNKQLVQDILNSVDSNCPIGDNNTTVYTLKQLEQSAPVICNWTVGFLPHSQPYGLSFVFNEPFLLYCIAKLSVNPDWDFFGFRSGCFTQPKPSPMPYELCGTNLTSKTTTKQTGVVTSASKQPQTVSTTTKQTEIVTTGNKPPQTVSVTTRQPGTTKTNCSSHCCSTDIIVPLILLISRCLFYY